MKATRALLARLALPALPALLGSLAPTTATASDHGDAPGTVADPAADIADVYAWHEDDVLTAVLTFAGAADAADPAVYDPDVLYAIHVDTNGDVGDGAEVTVLARFGQNALGEWGVQVLDLPGAGGPVVGPVQSVIAQGAVRVWSGLADDPYFFDQAGFVATLSSGDLAFTGADGYAGTNATALVLEMDLTDPAFGGSTTLQLWATTARR